MIAIKKDAMRYRDPETGKFVGVSLIGGDAPSGGTPVEIDTTLTQSGKAADAKVVGDKLTELNQALEQISTRTVTKIERTTTPSEPTATSGSAWAVAIATRVKNLGDKITKVKLRYISVGDATVSCKILADDFSTILASADSDKTVSSGYGYLEFDFTNANISNENVYICFEASDKVFTGYTPTGNYDADFVIVDADHNLYRICLYQNA